MCNKLDPRGYAPPPLLKSCQHPCLALVATYIVCVLSFTNFMVPTLLQYMIGYSLIPRLDGRWSVAKYSARGGGEGVGLELS